MLRKKFLSFFIAATMVFGMAVPAFASPVIDGESIVDEEQMGDVMAANASWNEEDGLIVRYDFEEIGQKTTVADDSGNGRVAKVHGSVDSVEQGVYGQAALLKGGYIHMPSDVLTDPVSGAALTETTVSIWLKTEDTYRNSSNDKRGINSHAWVFGSNTANYFNLVAPYENNGNPVYGSHIRLNDGGQSQANPSGAYHVNDVWENIVVTFKDDGGIMQMYRNGEKVYDQKVTTNNEKLAAYANATNSLIGRSQWKPDQDFYGYVDDFRVYNRVLSENEVQALAQDGYDSMMQQAVENLDLADFNGLKNLNGICDDLQLPGASYFKLNDRHMSIDIDWSSDDAGVITDNGSVIANGNANLTVEVTFNDFEEVTFEKTFAVTVADQGTPDQQEDVITIIGRKPELPSKVFANGGSQLIPVVWEAITPSDYAYAREVIINGTAAGQAVSVKLVVDGTKMTNPIVRPSSSQGTADPYVIFQDGYYYLVRTDFQTGVNVTKAKRLQDLETAPCVLVYKQAPGMEFDNEFWAPEMHYIDGCWYIYVAVQKHGQGNSSHRMIALRATDPEDAQSPYELAGVVLNEEGEDRDRWAIDGTILEAANGKLYFIWSGWPGTQDVTQLLYIAEMDREKPWILKGKRVLLSSPEQPWEMKDDGGITLLEGPQIIQKNGLIYILYSANHSFGNNYCLGILTIEDTVDADILNPSAWKKYPGPLFNQSLNRDDHVYSTGHPMLTVSPDGTEEWMIYHAYQNPNGNWINRSARAQKIDWDGDIPLMGSPKAYGEIIDQPSGTPKAVAIKYEAEEGIMDNSADPAGNKGSIGNQGAASGGGNVYLAPNTTLTIDVEIPVTGTYLLSMIGNVNTVNRNPNSVAGGVKDCEAIITIDGERTETAVFREPTSANVWVSSYDKKADRIGGGMYVDFEKGTHTLVIQRGESPERNLDLDYLYLLLQDEGEEEVEITLNKTAVTLKEGETFQLEATVTPATNTEPVTFTSDDTTVATVDQNGAIEAVAQGTAKITASVPSGASAVCTVTVKSDEDEKTELEELIESAEKENEADYTAESWARFNAQLTNAKTVAAKADATEREIKHAYSMLYLSMHLLEPADGTVNKLILQIFVDEAKEAMLPGGEYYDTTAEVQALFDIAYGKAVAVLDDPAATRDQVLEAALGLLEQLHNLGIRDQESVNFTRLEEYYTICTLVDTSQYGGVDEVNEFKAAMAEAKNILDNKDTSTQAQVDAAYARLVNAFNALTKIEGVDKSVLLAAITLSKPAIDNSDLYTNYLWDEFTAAYAKAVKVYEESDDQAEIDAAAKELAELVAQLRYKADKTKLKATVAKAEAINLSEYTPESANVLRAAMQSAMVLVNDENVSTLQQDEIDAVIAAIEKAILGLVPTDINQTESESETESEKQSETTKNSGKQKETNGNSGKTSGKSKVKTGDSNSIILYFAMCSIVAIGGALVVFKKRRVQK